MKKGKQIESLNFAELKAHQKQMRAATLRQNFLCLA